MNRIALIFLIISSSFICFGQEYSTKSKDLTLLNDSAYKLINAEEWDNAKQLLMQIELQSIRKLDSFNLSLCFHNTGILFYYKSDYNEAEINFERAYQIRKLLKDSTLLASTINNLGIMAMEKGNYALSVERFFESLRMHESLHDTVNTSNAYTNIGNVYYYEENFEKALFYYQKSLEIDLDANDNYGVAEDYQNIAIILNEKIRKNKSTLLFDSIETLLDNAILLYLEDNHSYEVANVLLTKGDLYQEFEMYEKAELCVKKALKTHQKLGVQIGVTEDYMYLGKLFLADNEMDSAIHYYYKSKKIAESVNALQFQKECSSALHDALHRAGNTKEAYVELLNYSLLKDSLTHKRNATLLADMNTKYETEKHVLEIKDLESQKIINIEKNEKQFIIIVSFAIGLGITFILLIIIYLKNEKEKKSKLLIEEQKDQLEEQHQDITDSINYAKRIQDALLKAETTASFSNRFTLFNPKDIVSGDFYWSHEQENHIYFAIADCTGHGVPGAFMSMLGISMLNQIVATSENLTPGEILDSLREKIINELGQYGKEGQSRDGMDISLIRLTKPKGEIKDVEAIWAGANNPLYIIKQELTEWEASIIPFAENEIGGEIKANNQPIGYYEKMVPFKDNVFTLQKGNTIYLFTDGFADQFGGKKGRKLKSKPFKRLLIAINSMTLSEQNNHLAEFFTTWRGENEQIDDVCVMGLKI